MGVEVTKRRFNLLLPEALYTELTAEADKRDTTVVELLRRFIKLGLLALKLEEDPDAELIIREGNKERSIVLY